MAYNEQLKDKRIIIMKLLFRLLSSDLLLDFNYSILKEINLIEFFLREITDWKKLIMKSCDREENNINVKSLTETISTNLVPLFIVAFAFFFPIYFISVLYPMFDKDANVIN